MSTLYIPYESEAFPPSTITNGSDELKVDMDDVLHAAITVGRALYSDIFAHGLASHYEAIFRWSLVKMSLEPTVIGRKTYLRRTEAFRFDGPQ